MLRRRTNPINPTAVMENADGSGTRSATEPASFLATKSRKSVLVGTSDLLRMMESIV